jgi:hypothetical protein
MTAAYQDKRITILDQGITVGQTVFTMNLVNSAAATHAKRSKPPWSGFFILLTATLILIIGAFWADYNLDGYLLRYGWLAGLLFLSGVLVISILIRCLWLNRKLVYNLTLDISGNDQIVLSSKDKDYIHMLAGLINAFKGYTPHPEPSFDYEGEVLE